MKASVSPRQCAGRRDRARRADLRPAGPQGHPGAHGQLAARKRRAGTHKTKGISDISGTTKKPYKQKARPRPQGSLRSPQFRGGAVIFGPVVRSHAHDLPKKVRKLALKTALSAKRPTAGWWCSTAPRRGTQDQGARRPAGQTRLGSVLVIDGRCSTRISAVPANLIGVDLLPQQGANVYDILRRDTLVLTRDAVQHLEARLK